LSAVVALFENRLTVQFDHRMLGYLLLGCAFSCVRGASFACRLCRREWSVVETAAIAL
jgi:hypothetical protein